jgi:uncharacterized protein involved in exopolysaccharide biosynthesis
MDRVIGDTEDSAVTAEMGRHGGMSGEEFSASDPTSAPKPEQSGIAEYARVLWRRKWIVIGIVVLAVGGVLGYCVSATKTYSATATVYLEPPVSNLLSATGGAPTTATLNVQDIIQIMESSSIANIVAKTIPNPPSISATQVGQASTLITSDIVTMSASSSSPETAAAAANAYANAYINFQKGLEKSTFQSAENQIGNKVATVQLAISNLTNQLRTTPAGVNLTADEVQLGDLENQLTDLQNSLQEYQFAATQGTSSEVGRVISAATVPSSPSSPHTTEYVVLAFIFSAIVGVGVALLVNAISRRRA